MGYGTWNTRGSVVVTPPSVFCQEIFQIFEKFLNNEKENVRTYMHTVNSVHVRLQTARLHALGREDPRIEL